MKTKFHSIAICITLCLFLLAGKTNATTKIQVRDTICCAPDSLKVVSTNYPVFCVSWIVSTDSSCKTPYGFEIQWRPFPGSGPWTGKIKTYTGGTLITFCDSVSICGGYQWRVRTICDSLTGNTTYSDWVYGNKFAMKNCAGQDLTNQDDLKKTNNSAIDKRRASPQAIKPKEN